MLFRGIWHGRKVFRKIHVLPVLERRATMRKNTDSRISAFWHKTMKKQLMHAVVYPFLGNLGDIPDTGNQAFPDLF